MIVIVTACLTLTPCFIRGLEVIPSTPAEAGGLSASASESALMEGMIVKMIPAILAFNYWYGD
jgi:hypothetical protein